MDNQATKVIKQFLDEQQCNLLLVKPHNHHVNAAKRAVQTFKVHFIRALATTDSEFPLQLWDQLTAQVESTFVPTTCQPQYLSLRAIYGPYN
jgi:hypothetical protein